MNLIHLCDSFLYICFLTIDTVIHRCAYYVQSFLIDLLIYVCDYVFSYLGTFLRLLMYLLSLSFSLICALFVEGE